MATDYDVFFSYRHRPLDNEMTQRAFNMLESYRLPQALRKAGYENIRRAFRDTEELPVSRILTETIDRALRSARCLVVVCSEDTPSSEWIDREVSIFIELGRADHIYPLLISGDPDHSFPPSLKLVPDIAERIMDVRVPGNDRKKMTALLEPALLKVISGVSGCPEQELRREHDLRRNRRLAWRTTVIAAVFLAVAGVSLLLMQQAQRYRDNAQVRQQASLRILSELTYTLPNRLSDVPGAWSRIRDVLYRNTEDINTLLLLSPQNEAASFEVAANYEKLATAENALGEPEAALASEALALDTFHTLAEADYPGAEEALASAYNNRGRFLFDAGHYADASADFEEALHRLRSLPDPDPLTLARTEMQAGNGCFSTGAYDVAEAHYEESLSLLVHTPDSPQRTTSLVSTEYNYGLLLYSLGRYDKAIEYLSDADRLYDAYLPPILYQEETGLWENLTNREDRRMHVRVLDLLGSCLLNRDQPEASLVSYLKALSLAEALAQHSDNLDDLRALAALHQNCGNLLSLTGDRGELSHNQYALASEQYYAIWEKTGSASDAVNYAVSLRHSAELAFYAGELEQARTLDEAGLAVYGAVCAELGNYHLSYYLAWLSYYDLIHLRDPAAALEAAENALALDPEQLQTKLTLAYACLYSGNNDAADALFSELLSLGSGLGSFIRADLDAQRQAGLYSEHIDAVYEMLDALPEIPEAA